MNVRRLKKIITDKINSEIPPNLKYHGLHHTIGVYDVCNAYIRRLKIKPHEAYLLRSAALTHDIGILSTYSDHETAGIEYINELLPQLGYSKKDIRIISKMIESTRLPQNPKTLLEKVICDADLDYIGTDQFYSIGNTLFEEFLLYGVVKNEKEWDLLQINFLENHYFHTEFAKKNRQPVKQVYIQELRKKWKIK